MLFEWTGSLLAGLAAILNPTPFSEAKHGLFLAHTTLKRLSKVPVLTNLNVRSALIRLEEPERSRKQLQFIDEGHEMC